MWLDVCLASPITSAVGSGDACTDIHRGLRDTGTVHFQGCQQFIGWLEGRQEVTSRSHLGILIHSHTLCSLSGSGIEAQLGLGLAAPLCPLGCQSRPLLLPSALHSFPGSLPKDAVLYSLFMKLQWSHHSHKPKFMSCLCILVMDKYTTHWASATWAQPCLAGYSLDPSSLTRNFCSGHEHFPLFLKPISQGCVPSSSF